ncbi:MAG: HAD family phosphatase [Clostridia bacterium]|nr:HAD family phosphatase [Clostridia bacterium]
MGKIKNVIFDFGRVIVTFDELAMTREYIPDEDDALLAHGVIFDRKYWDLLDLGTIADEKVEEGIRARLPERLHEGAITTFRRWIHHIPLIAGMEDAVAFAKARARGLYLLSNISPYFSAHYKENPDVARVLSHFDGLVFSGDLHLVKPDRRIFEYLLSTYGIRAEETLFIDDSEKNIAGAMAVGLQTYLFDGDAQRLIAYLDAVL